MRNVLERLINLVAMLITAERPVTADRIRRTIPGYSAGSDEAFHRMFERDKEMLRRVGVPVELRATDAWEVDHGYLIDPAKYRLPDIGLTDEERAALSIAARVVRLGGDQAVPSAILKLGGDRLTSGAEPLSADLGAAAENLGDLFEALSDRRILNFSYRGQQRRAAPYGLGHRRGHWYLVGATREGQRTYRVDRMERISLEPGGGAFQRPSDFSLAAAMASLPWEAGPEQEVKATVSFRPEIAWWASRQLGAKTSKPSPDGSMVATVEVANREAFLGWVLSFGDGAEVLSPPELRQALIDRVRGVA
ncbi:MAG: helix-turn-helix transcriptional regulator [Actinomycetota bacterium]